MREYRCTRSVPYYPQNCPGRNDRTSRQGYYLDAASFDDAMHQMTKKFPEDIPNAARQGIVPFTADLWWTDEAGLKVY